MDLLRSTIKSLLYEFSPEALIEYLTSGSVKDDEDFYDRVGELNTWSEKGFTLSEITLLNQVLRNEWLTGDKIGFSVDAPYHPYERIFLILQHCGDILLDLSRNVPKVKFRNLLRWRELTLAIGEDTLILPTLAKNDVEINIVRNSFLWPNTLDHNDVQLNALLDDTLSDTHFHLNAGCDVFEFNWLIVMNNPRAVEKNPPEFMGKARRRSYDTLHRFHSLNLSLGEWTLIACWLRAALLDSLFDEKANPIEDLTVLSNNPDSWFIDVAGRTETLIDRFRIQAIKTSNQLAFDYAINSLNTKKVPPAQMTDVYMVHHGERWLVYTFLTHYFGGEDRFRRLSPLLYLYLLIKNKVRREFIQNNVLRGFENFQIYQSLKQHFFNEGDKASNKALNEIAFRYAVQSALGSKFQHYLEARVVPRSVGFYQKADYWTSIFGNREVVESEKRGAVTIVAHFIKHPDEDLPADARFIRHGVLREKLRIGLKDIIKGWNRNCKDEAVSKFVGIDAASSELGCRPEVFAPVFQEARRKGIPNITYHVGEDFYDIVDGLRAIDEAVEFLLPDSGGRLGHAIALGIDARKYYFDRHRYIVISCQDLLDNMVWMKYKSMDLNVSLHPSTLLFITECFAQYTEQLGYGVRLNDFHYWESMRRRQDDPLNRVECLSDERSYSDEELASPEGLLDNYWFNAASYRAGKRVISVRLPESFVEDVVKIQEKMLCRIGERGIFIETNPTSNMRIGGFSRYKDLPLLKFHSVDECGHKLPVTINTDDKGVFATSLKNEYSLVAAALSKERDESGSRRWNDRQIMDYIKRIAAYGNISRFIP